MPLQVPRAERQVQETALRAPQVSAPAPIEAFGGGASATAVKDAGNSLINVALDEKRKADDTATTDYYAKLSEKKQSLFWDAKSGVITKKGKDSFSAPDDYGKQFDDYANSLEENLSHDQIAMAKSIRAKERSEFDGQIMRHVAKESEDYQNETVKAGIAAARSDAVLNFSDPNAIEQKIKLQESIYDQTSSGKPPELVAQEKAELRSKTQAAVVDRMLDNGMDKEAQAHFNNVKSQFTGTDVDNVEKSLQGAKVLTQGKDAWTNMQSYKLPDGNPDEARMEKAVMALDIPDREKEKVWDFVKSKAGEAKSQKAARDSANDRAFLNVAVQSRKNNVPVEDALAQAKKYSSDSYDQALKEDAVHKIYAPAEIKSDPAVKVALSDAIDEGTATRDDVDRAYQKQQISANDWVAFRNRYHNVVQEGKSPLQQRANEQIKILAKSQFGSDTAGMNQFLSEVKSDAMGKSPDEMVKIANDKIKQDAGSVSRFWNWVPLVGGKTIPGSGHPQYETDISKRTNDSLIKGQLSQDLGSETVKAIELSNARSGSKQSVAESVDAMSVAFGGYSNIKPGTPAYNAMRSLSKHGKVVSVDSIKAALSRHQDGNF